MGANEATEAKAVSPGGDAICEDKGSRQLTSSIEQTCEIGGVVNAKCSTSPTSGLYHVPQ